MQPLKIKPFQHLSTKSSKSSSSIVSWKKTDPALVISPGHTLPSTSRQIAPVCGGMERWIKSCSRHPGLWEPHDIAGHCWGSTPQNCQVPRGIQLLIYILGSESCQVGIEKYYMCEQHVSIYGILTRQQHRNELYHYIIYQSFQPCIACIPHKPSTTLVPTSVFYEWIRTLSV